MTEILYKGSCKRFGSEFHVDGPATANARLPYVTRRCGGTEVNKSIRIGWAKKVGPQTNYHNSVRS